MVTRNPLSLRSPRVRALVPVLNRRLSNYLRTHLLYLITLHGVNDRSTRPAPPNIILISLPLLGNPPKKFLGIFLVTLLPVNSLATLLLTPFLASPPNLANKALSLSPRALYIRNTATVRSRADTTLPTTTLLPLLNPRSRIPNNPPLHSPSSTTLHLVSPELTLARRASSLLHNRLTKLVLSFPVFLRRDHRAKLPSRDQRSIAGGLL